MNTRQAGTTLLELACYLALLTILLGLVGAPFSHTRDLLAVRAGRDALVAASARTRSHAIGHGGADLRIDAAAGTLRIISRDSVVDQAEDLGQQLGVQIRIDNTQATAVTLPYDALGIGRLAGRTISIRRGGVTGGVTFSSYGRPRVW